MSLHGFIIECSFCHKRFPEWFFESLNLDETTVAIEWFDPFPTVDRRDLRICYVCNGSQNEYPLVTKTTPELPSVFKQFRDPPPDYEITTYESEDEYILRTGAKSE